MMVDTFTRLRDARLEANQRNVVAPHHLPGHWIVERHGKRKWRLSWQRDRLPKALQLRKALAFIGDAEGEDAETWRIFAIAAGIGPYLVQLAGGSNELSIAITFRDDGSEYYVGPDGDTGREENRDDHREVIQP